MIIIKSQREIDGIRKSSQLAADTLVYLGSLIKIGITTQELNDAAARFIENRGGKSATFGYPGVNGAPPFPGHICTSVNDVVCHGIPDSRPLKSGDIIKLDVTTILDGFFGDNAATYEVGQVSKKAKGLIDVTKRCLEIGIAQVKPGNRTGMIGHAIGTYAWNKGYTVVFEFAGHGCGIKFHEEPTIVHVSPAEHGPVMKEGMTFTIEPMINLGAPKVRLAADRWTALTNDGSLSAQFEHTVLVTKDGCEILTLPTPL